MGGGTATVTCEFSKRLSLLPHLQSELITSNGFGLFNQDCVSPAGCKITKLPLAQRCIHHASVFDLMRFSWAALRHLIARRDCQSFDVVLAWCTVPAGLVALILKKLYNLPFVVRVSGPDIPGFELRYRMLYPLLRPLVRSIWRASHSVICKCDDEAERVLNILPDARVKIVPNGVDTETYYPSATRSTRSTVSIVCVARLIERKGQRLAIRALAQLRKNGTDVVLTLVGEGDSRDDYERLARELGVSEFVRFTGALPRESIPAIYRNFDIFLLPSSAESMSVACLEALASGLPLVVSCGGGVESFVTHQENGFLVPHGDLDALVKALETLAHNESLRLAFGERSRLASQRFSWTTTTQGIVDVLAEAAADCSASASALPTPQA